MSGKQFCLLPEGALYVQPNGNITPCCLSTTPEDKLGNIAVDGLKSVFFGEEFTKFRLDHRKNILSASCKHNCIDNVNNLSHRTNRSNMLRGYHAEGDEYTKLNMVDIGFGNVCKLTCSFCGPEWSSSWAKLKNEPNNVFHFSREEILNTVKDLSGVHYASIKGGEPLNIPYIEEFFEELYKVNPQIVLDILTNGVEVSPRIIETLCKFPNLVLTVSVEATGDLYKYLRGGKYSWEENTFKNIELFAKNGLTRINIASLILLYNHSTWPDHLFDIYNDLKSIMDKVNISTQLCLNPSNQDIFCLDKPARQDLVNRIAEKVEQGLPLNDVAGISKLLLQDRESNASFKEVIDGVDYFNNLRNMDLFSIVDNFTELLSVKDPR